MPQTDRAIIRHPQHALARLVRVLRGLRHLRGWNRAVSLLVPRSTRGGFTIANHGVLFQGDIGSFVDREVYLTGGYESAAIDAFLQRAPSDRRGTALDVGANAGVHSLRLARAFKTVHAFEPNRALWDQFERNMALNGLDDVVLHRMGLGREAGQLPLYNVEGDNGGLATLVAAPQYDRPLRPVGKVEVACGDTVVTALGVGRVDAIKIDVQGYEVSVLAGLAGTLARDRPQVWVEAGGDAPEAIKTLAALRALFPYPVEVTRFQGVRRRLTHGWEIIPAEDRLAPGDYWVTPAT